MTRFLFAELFGHYPRIRSDAARASWQSKRVETAPSQVRAFFDEFLSVEDRAAFLRQLLADEREEEWLDFKGSIDRNPKPGDKPLADGKVKSIFSQAVCGFANTAGGVLVWGIDCTKNAQGIDCASGFARTSEPAKLKARLRELCLPAGDPPVPGSRSRPSKTRRRRGEGFVVCFVPESRLRPHRAELSDRRFFIRANDSFVDAPVSLLRNLFMPQVRPVLAVEFMMGAAKSCLFGLFVEMTNRGTRTADDIFLWAKCARATTRRASLVLIPCF